MPTYRNSRLFGLTSYGVVSLCFAVSLAAQTKNTCLDCHQSMDPPLGIRQDAYAKDIHLSVALNCTACHGGDSSADDAERAMSKAAGFRGHIERKDVPQLCGKCHSDASYMRQFNPSLRTDQLAQYATSRHGKLLAKGDTNVAVCIDCHGVHGILPPSDTRSPVRPTNVAATCSRCHSNAEYMKGYKISTNQYADYMQSIHHEALTARGDASAPTCSTCHGNHGATPPQVASVENVCATCHPLQAQLFDKSRHKQPFTAASLPGCVTCHGNHKIAHATDNMLASNENSVCIHCHAAGTPAHQLAVSMHESMGNLETAIMRSDEILDRAERSGMEVGDAKLRQSQARDALTKARVDVHALSPALFQTELTQGLKTAATTYQAGQQALAERDFRRKGLGVSLLVIAFVVASLWMYIRELER